MLEHWYTALGSRFGIRLETDNVKLLQAKLYAARKASGDPALAGISIVIPPNTLNELWLVKREPSE